MVAGSSRGIGRAIAEAFLREGARVVLSGRNPASLEATRQAMGATYGEGQVMACRGDVRDPGTASSMLGLALDAWGRLDCVVANVGTGKGRPGWKLSGVEWRDLFDANFFVSTGLVEGLLTHLIPERRGCVLFISSIVALEATAAPLPYSAAKAALENYSKNLARVLAPHGIRVNTLAPGNVLFPGGTWEGHLAAEPENVRHYIDTEVPMRRFGRPEEIADVAVFLCSERASFITGACIVADGGQKRGL